MDIYQRTCKKEGVIMPDEKTSEILTVCSCEEEMCEEECYIPEDEPIDLQLIDAELECMKRRIQKLQLKLKIDKIEPCPDEPCVNFELELTCSENKDICKLQKNQHKLQCQINELCKCCKCAKEQIADLRMRMCEKSRQILELQKTVEMLYSWKNTLEHEFGICIERFEYLKHVKAEWKDVHKYMENYKKCQNELNGKFITKHCFKLTKDQFIRQLAEVRHMFYDLFGLNKNLKKKFSFTKKMNVRKLSPEKYSAISSAYTTSKVKKSEAKKEEEQRISQTAEMEVYDTDFNISWDD